MNIRFVIDSACDVPPDVAQNHQMTVLPAFVNYGGHSHEDSPDFDRAAYYDQLPTLNPLPTTAAPSPGIAAESIEAAAANADHLILLSIASSLSGMHNIMRLGSANLPPGSYTLVDSQSISLGAGFQAIVGAEVAAQTGDLTAVLAAIEHTRQHAMVYAGMRGLEYVRRGGRVNWAVGAVGGLLRIRPVVAVSGGQVTSVARVRKPGAWLNTVSELALRHAPLARLALLHTNNTTDLDVLRQHLQPHLPASTFTVLATPAIGTHTGPGAIGVALVGHKDAN